MSAQAVIKSAPFPPGWAEWNDRFRDTVRSYWKGDDGKLADLAARITGSGDLFNRRGRKPWASVNFVTAHDGFTLNDLVSYDTKHNEANGEENRDGPLTTIRGITAWRVRLIIQKLSNSGSGRSEICLALFCFHRVPR